LHAALQQRLHVRHWKQLSLMMLAHRVFCLVQQSHEQSGALHAAICLLRYSIQNSILSQCRHFSWVLLVTVAQ
jgi:hypothetical protein